MTVHRRSYLTSLALLASAACAGNQPTADTAGGASNTSREVASGTTGERSPTQAFTLAWSKPAAGSVVNSPVNELVLHFSAPARLLEVTVTGPDGTMPMMVTAVGEVEHYSLPLSGLGPGRYDVAWRASAGGTEQKGAFGFEVR